MSDHRDPQNQEEWQSATDLADMHLLLHSAKLYGLTDGGPEINVHRCEEMISRARDLDIHPNWTTDDLHRLLSAYTDDHIESRGEAQSEGGPHRCQR